MLKTINLLLAAGSMLLALNASAAYTDDLLAAADEGECVAIAVADLIRKDGPDKAAEIVTAGLEVAAQRKAQQEALGCQGDIAEQAIAAGADPDDVLAATAAGIGPNGGAPANLGGIGGNNAGGGAGTASAS
jgi:hypothetical protein